MKKKKVKRKNAKYRKRRSLKKQVKDRFEQLTMIGESRLRAKQVCREYVAGG